MNWRVKLKHAIPPSLLNNLLLTFPIIYETNLVRYETNLGRAQTDELLTQLSKVLSLEGNIIECGSSRCGASVIMAKYLQSQDISKRIYACDSFAGFDLAELERERYAGWTSAPDTTFTSTSYEYVQKKLERLKVDEIVLPVKGFFQETLLHIDSKFCLAFIDCDLRDSLIYCAETIWPNLVSGGRMVFDDYTAEDYKGAQPGVDFFVDQRRSEIGEHGLLSGLYYVCKK